ncbi:MAG: hypothetical protein HYU33_00105 [Candidatus Omnitrophica bacterium]|nr:hypothetical protein [Candidatus Omnitrophota bacterium]
MRDGENALLGRSGKEIAQVMIRTAADKTLRERIGYKGRLTYERWFRPEVSGLRIVESLERIASQTLASTSPLRPARPCDHYVKGSK